jgi:ATP-dependent phosphofructokinase / diphosphate-dependent phosphofructokinase
VHQGQFGQMICFNPPKMDSVAIADAVSRLRTVDPHCDAVQAARALGSSFGDCRKAHSAFHAPLVSETVCVPAVAQTA